MQCSRVELSCVLSSPSISKTVSDCGRHGSKTATNGQSFALVGWWCKSNNVGDWLLVSHSPGEEDDYSERDDTEGGRYGCSVIVRRDSLEWKMVISLFSNLPFVFGGWCACNWGVTECGGVVIMLMSWMQRKEGDFKIVCCWSFDPCNWCHDGYSFYEERIWLHCILWSCGWTYRGREKDSMGNYLIEWHNSVI